jgi:hypothetical protein
LAATVILAKPDALVTAVGLDSIALAPLTGVTAKVTVTPANGLLPASATSTWSGLANAVLMGVLCPLPPATVSEAGTPGRLVSKKLTDRPGPALAPTA